MKAPFFSVLLPVFNAKAHITNALNDILAQSFRDFEILVVDDGSTDGSIELIEQFEDSRIRIVKHTKNLGLVAALNSGLAAANGVWVARQDADDRCRFDRLEKQARLIMSSPDSVLFYSHAKVIDARGWWRGKICPPLDDLGLRWDLCFRNSVPHTAAVFPLFLVRDKLGGYQDIHACEDFDLWSRLLHHGKALGTNECLVSYRMHAGSIMGKENSASSKKSKEKIRSVMIQNLLAFSKASNEQAEIIVEAWIDPSRIDWSLYFQTTMELSRGALNPPKLLIAEQDYALFHRAVSVSGPCGASLLASLRKEHPERFSALPHLRMLITRILNRL